MKKLSLTALLCTLILFCGCSSKRAMHTPQSSASGAHTETESGTSAATEEKPAETTVLSDFAADPAGDSAAGGAIGNGFLWSFSGGTLTISGDGEMPDFDHPIEDDTITTPWYPFRDEIRNVVFSGRPTRIGNYTFRRCRSLTAVELPDSVTYVGGGTFMECTALTSVTLPDSITVIAYDAFRECTSLTEITLPMHLTKIINGTFSDCTSLVRCIMPNTLTSIGAGAFQNCTGIQTFELPGALTEFESYALRGCSRLKYIHIPHGIESLPSQLCSGCSELDRIVYDGTIAEWNAIEKDAFWLDDSVNPAVHCTDGKIPARPEE